MDETHNAIEIMRPPSVFLSYAHTDRAVAIEFYHLLDLDGFKPWIDEINLIAGQRWQTEIERAVTGSDCVVVLLSKRSVDHAGYIQKEISLALEAATREPEQGIFVLPVCLDESPVPNRLTHLHSVRSIESPELIGAKYLSVQRALIMRAEQLNDRHDFPAASDRGSFWKGKTGLIGSSKTEREMVSSIKSFPIKSYGISRLLWTGGDYLVRGRNPGGSTYAGVARLDVHEGDADLNVMIGMHHLSYKGTFDGEILTLKGSHEVTYDIRLGDGIFRGVWEKTGLEELIPASPFAKRVSSQNKP